VPRAALPRPGHLLHERPATKSTSARCSAGSCSYLRDHAARCYGPPDPSGLDQMLRSGRMPASTSSGTDHRRQPV